MCFPKKANGSRIKPNFFFAPALLRWLRPGSYIRQTIRSNEATWRHGIQNAGSLVGSIDSWKTHHWETVFRVNSCTHALHFNPSTFASSSLFIVHRAYPVRYTFFRSSFPIHLPTLFAASSARRSLPLTTKV